MCLKVKICGITNSSDAWAAVEAGADALGFMFYEPSPRHVSFSVAAEITRNLPPFIARVGVFVDASADFVQRAADECGLDTLQFHGSESPEFCLGFSLKSIKAFRIRDENSLRELSSYQTSAWLLDAFVANKLGGTGVAFNWELACLARKFGRPIILAGGLQPENVAEAIRKVQPFAVDVSSGVEASVGKKDHLKLRAFIQAARSAQP